MFLVYQLLESIKEDGFHVFNNLNYLPTYKPRHTNNSLFVHAFGEAFIKMLIRKPLQHFLFGQESYISQFGTQGFYTIYMPVFSTLYMLVFSCGCIHLFGLCHPMYFHTFWVMFLRDLIPYICLYCLPSICWYFPGVAHTISFWMMLLSGSCFF